MAFEIDKNAKKITMNEGDFGIVLNFVFSKIVENSYYEFIVYDTTDNGDSEIMNKKIQSSEVTENKVPLRLTKEESNLIKQGEHYWKLVNHRDNEFKNTLLVDKRMKVNKG